MDFEYIQKLPPDQRKELLAGDALEILENAKYTKPLTPEEVVFWRGELSDQSVLQSEILQEKKEVIASYSTRLRPISEKIGMALKAVKYKAIDCEGTLYKIADFDQKMVHTLDEHGNLVNSRQMLPAERQFRIQALKQESA